MKCREFLTEAAAPSIGRKYQHLEDLVYTNGSQGALHAIERLRRLAQDYGSIEVKWDGSPVVYWGRDDSGKFYMYPKNAWAYRTRNKDKTTDGVSTVMDSPRAVEKFITGTGDAKTAEQVLARKSYAKMMAMLYPVFEAATPENFRGFVEGGLLFYPEKPAVYRDGEYHFKPNVTEFAVRGDSDLGERIRLARAGVAVTGYYPGIGADESRLDARKIAQLNGTEGLVVQGPVFVERAPKISTNTLDLLKRLQADILKNRQIIDNYLAAKPAVKSPGAKIYDFMGDQRKTNFAALDAAFPQWAKNNLSEKQAAAMLEDEAGYTAVLRTVALLQQIKDSMIDQFLEQTKEHSVIRQVNPEGFAQAHQGGYEFDLPDQFVKYIKRKEWQPR